MGRVYMEAKRADTPFMSAMATCTKNKKCTCKYVMTIDNSAEVATNKQFVEVNVEKQGTHEHDEHDRKEQLRGEVRKEIVEDCLLKNKGSATAFVDEIVI